MATASDAEQLQKQAVAPAPVTSSEPIQSSAQSRSLAKTDAQGPRSDSSHRKVSGHLRLDTHELYDGSLGNGSGGIGGRTRSDRTSVLSFSRRAAQIGRTPTPFLVEGDRHLLRDIERPPPGDPRTRLHANRRSLSQEGDAPASAPAAGRNVNVSGTIARKRSQYFEEAFSTRDADASLSKERVGIETPVLAKVQTNVLVGDEFTFVTGLSAHLALRYRRPLTSIIVTLRHGACMCFGGSFAPAYVMTVSALPAQLQPVTNKHNAALIQRHMEQTLGVPPARGYLQFVAVPEANLAYGGKTAMGHTHHGPAKVGSSSLSKSASYSPNGMYPSPTESTSPNPIDMAVGPEYTTESRKSSLIRRLSVKVGQPGMNIRRL
ncbi:hypothetical protein SEPCBS119000_005187 [Sporothrix epigloea]|uniref:L-dopachrome isomerase n=1 Tax=Sporothrix epigloea TaxID=1892477 RepID=A0ABP0DW80_9PEZI